MPETTRERYWPQLDIETISTEDVRLGSDADIAFLSMAISLKRIADTLNNRDPYDNPIAQAILNGISQGAQDWIGHMARNGR